MGSSRAPCARGGGEVLLLLRGAGARDSVSGVLPRGGTPLVVSVVECVVGAWLRVCGRVRGRVRLEAQAPNVSRETIRG